MELGQFSTILANWAFNVNPKKKGLIFYGKSNSGKTFLSNLLCSMFPVEYVGVFNCPTGNNPSQFLF